MGYKVSQINIDRFREAADLTGFSNLDIRLGIEAMIYNVPFRTVVTSHWGGQISSMELICSENTCDAFRLVSPKHTMVSDEMIRDGMTAIIDDPDFQDSCRQRWAVQDAQPPTEVVATV